VLNPAAPAPWVIRVRTARRGRSARRSSLTAEAGHDSIRNLLSRLQEVGRITEVVEDADVAFATEPAKGELFDWLRDFATSRKAWLGQIFGSRKHGFWYLPQQFLLVSDGDSLRELFPCQIGDSQVEPLEYLERGQPGPIARARGWKGKAQGACSPNSRPARLLDPDWISAVRMYRSPKVLANWASWIWSLRIVTATFYFSK